VNGFLRGGVFAVAELMWGHGNTVINGDELYTSGRQLPEACREAVEKRRENYLCLSQKMGSLTGH